ncbi:MAG: hypothetical protein ABI591_11755 [Kofleriaceae bacterium]
MTTDQTFVGTFEPPTIGHSVTPIALAGEGTLATTSAGLVAKGFKGSGSGLAFVTFILVTAGALAVYYLLATYVLHSRMSAGGMGGAIAAGVLSAAATSKRAGKQAYELVIPWTSVTKVDIDKQRDDVTIRIKKHKPSGSLHFKPTDKNNGAVVAALLERI